MTASTQQRVDTVVEALRATPAATASGLILFGIPLQDWVLIGSALLIFLQIVFLLRDKVWRPYKEYRDARKAQVRG